MSPSSVIAGNRYSRLITIEPACRKQGKKAWLCQCDCGLTTIVIEYRLRIGKVRSCGCLKKEVGYRNRIYSKEDSTWHAYHSLHKISAKRRNLISLDFQNWKNLSRQSCHYCGTMPSNREYPEKNKTGGDKISINGIDRMDSSKDYALDNCVPCCTTCNKRKMDMPYEEFKMWLSRCYHHLQLS